MKKKMNKNEIHPVYSLIIAVIVLAVTALLYQLLGLLQPFALIQNFGRTSIAAISGILTFIILHLLLVMRE